ncbi:MAG: recombinase family protein [Proteobacteria bacterium]|nr:recombinase family protein [Pseudomonadota bacterium]
MRVAAYARYSSDMQSSASLDDQLRNCLNYCTRMGWPDPEAYTDAAISGARNDRPAYRRLLADAQQFDVILIDDMSRLSRDSVEIQQQVRRLKFSGVRVISISDGIDTADKGHKLGVGLRGLMGELYLDDLREKTHRGLTGKALDGSSAGGLPYGYRVTTTGQREIIPEQAAVVRRIYADYLSGLSSRQIAHALNAEGIRTARDRTWAISAIHPNTEDSVGILANPIYRGRMVWNRSQWIKNPETGRRTRRNRPESEWITHEHPELAIVDPATWDAVQAAVKRRSHAQVGNRGRRPKNLLSGLLKCDVCGGPIVAISQTAYGCSTAKDRGTCNSTVRVNRRKAEAAMLAGVRSALLSPEAEKAWQAAIARELRVQQESVEDTRRQLAKAIRERENVMAAIRQGIILPSTKAELERLEQLVASLEGEARRPAKMMPAVRERLQRIADTLSERSAADPAVREALRAVIGEAVLETKNGAPVARVAPILGLVAGVGFEPTTFGL